MTLWSVEDSQLASSDPLRWPGHTETGACAGGVLILGDVISVPCPCSSLPAAFWRERRARGGARREWRCPPAAHAALQPPVARCRPPRRPEDGGPAQRENGQRLATRAERTPCRPACCSTTGQPCAVRMQRVCTACRAYDRSWDRVPASPSQGRAVAQDGDGRARKAPDRPCGGSSCAHELSPRSRHARAWYVAPVLVTQARRRVAAR